jgi:adenine-specific DNA-methyltransferase
MAEVTRRLSMNSLLQFQALLRDLFQLDLADLDFGLYRLLPLKRQEVEDFLTEKLPRRVEEAFQSVAGEDALLENGEPRREHPGFQAKVARELLGSYEAKRRQLQSVQTTEAQRAEVFNYLYAFFSRYFEAGDFIPRRRYGTRETYAAPYNGEEVFFHWANKDQHYVKTGEVFRDYAFTVEGLNGPFRVRFVLTEASVPPGNTKGHPLLLPSPGSAHLGQGIADTSTPFPLPASYRKRDRRARKE